MCFSIHHDGRLICPWHPCWLLQWHHLISSYGDQTSSHPIQSLQSWLALVFGLDGMAMEFAWGVAYSQNHLFLSQSKPLRARNLSVTLTGQKPIFSNLAMSIYCPFLNWSFFLFSGRIDIWEGRIWMFSTLMLLRSLHLIKPINPTRMISNVCRSLSDMPGLSNLSAISLRWSVLMGSLRAIGWASSLFAWTTRGWDAGSGIPAFLWAHDIPYTAAITGLGVLAVEMISDRYRAK